MIDELDLVFEDRAERARDRRAIRRGVGGGRKKSSGGRKKGGGGRAAVVLVSVLVLLGVLGGGAVLGLDRVQGALFTPDYDGDGTGEIVVEVKEGAFLADIGNALVEAGVVKSTKAFLAAAEDNPRSHNIHPGLYRLRRQMSGESALSLLLDVKNKVSNKVTLSEGRTVKQTFKLLSEQTKIAVKDFEAAAKDPVALGVPDSWYTRNDGKKVVRSIEGFLFPDTYEFNPNATAEEILTTMVRNFLRVTDEMKFVERVAAERGGISAYEALIVASLAQAEAGNPDDLGKIARVAYNRAYGDFPCNCLEMDVTVNYWLEVNGKPTKASKDMTNAELNDPKNPYNRKLRGMIPTPINNPGKQALTGAMDPPPGKFLYFVAIDRQGHSAFAETIQEHERNKAKARENGII